MNQPIIGHQDYLDVIFHNRNKAYGSYTLRKAYNSRLRKAFIYAIMLFCLPFVFFTIIKNEKIDQNDLTFNDPVTLSPISIDDFERSYTQPILPNDNVDVAALSKPDLIDQANLTTLKIVDDNKIDPNKSIATVDDLKDKVAGFDNYVGSGNGTYEGVKEGTGSHINVPPLGADPPIVPKPKFVAFAEVMPQFPGGQAALLKWLEQNLRYPTAALQNGIEGKVYASFIIDENGKLQNIVVERSFGYGSEEEVKRLLSIMPTWSPGKQNGQLVKVLFKLPITFRLD